MKENSELRARFREHLPAVLGIFVLALIVRGLTAYFIGTHLDDAGWFPSGIFKVFHEQAAGILNGTKPAFWIVDTSDPTSAIYPPGYSLWLAAVYAVSGVKLESTERVLSLLQVLQLLLDSVSVLLILAIGTAAFRWQVGLMAGIAAALSPLLAFYGATPLADAPTSWIVLGGVLSFVLAYKKESVLWALAAGFLLGLSCWFRANGLLLTGIWAIALMLLIQSGWKKRIQITSALLFAAALVIAPVVVRNSIAFEAFVPTGLGAGTNLWEGIGETSRAEEFGAVYGDRELIEKERVEQNLGDDPRVTLYWPDGVVRDRARMKKALSVIGSDPVWYAGVMGKRMSGLLKYAGDDSPIYGSTGINVTPSKSLPDAWRFIPVSTVVTALGWLQSAFRFIVLPLILMGIFLALRTDLKMALIVLTTVFYYLVFGTFLHSEIRYSLPMQAVLMVFAGVAASGIGSFIKERRNVVGN